MENTANTSGPIPACPEGSPENFGQPGSGEQAISGGSAREPESGNYMPSGMSGQPYTTTGNIHPGAPDQGQINPQEPDSCSCGQPGDDIRQGCETTYTQPNLNQPGYPGTAPVQPGPYMPNQPGAPVAPHSSAPGQPVYTSVHAPGQNIGSSPGYGIPPQGMPQQSVPPQGMPQQGVPPQQGMSQQSVPPQGMPQQGVPPQGMPGYQGIPAAPYGWSASFQPGQQFTGHFTPPFTPQQPGTYGSAPSQSPHFSDHNTGSDHSHPKFDEHKYGQFMGIMSDLANGNPDVSKMMNFLEGLDTQFWKGALIGVTATLLLTNETVKSAIVGALSGAWGIFQQETKEENK